MTKRRSLHFVDVEVQSTLVLRLCLHWVVFLITTSIATFFWIHLTEGPTGDWHQTWVRFSSTLMPLVLVSLALLPPFILDAVKLSNRFSGPVYRLRRALSMLAKGQTVRPLEFRSNDFWTSLAQDFNQVLLRRASTEANPSDSTTEPKGS